MFSKKYFLYFTYMYNNDIFFNILVLVQFPDTLGNGINTGILKGKIVSYSLICTIYNIERKNTSFSLIIDNISY